MADIYIPLNQGAGYGVVVGLGMAFAVAMMLITYVLKRYNREIMTAEEFSTAGRSVKKYLISACVVSSWTWSATLLTSTTQTYKNGVGGAYYYAAGACVQIIFFSCLGLKAKQRAPNAHTYLEIIEARYGKTAHLVFCVWGLITNILVTAMLLSGGSAVLSNLTGMNIVAACLLLPLGVVIYTIFGGLKATFITDYINGAAVVIIALVFGFVVWCSGSALGSPGKVWELVKQAGIDKPREGNENGSYLTMKSRAGGIFFAINVAGNTSIYLDTAYFSKIFAASPRATMPGYIIGGITWFAIPFFTATTMGLAALALEDTPYWPTYPQKLTDFEVNAGLVLPNAAVAIMGKGGAVASLILMFTAATSAMSSELIAVSNVVTFDIYRTYFKPEATGKQLMTISHITVVIFAYVMAGFAIGLYYAGVSMGYLYELMGILMGGAVIPSICTLLSSKQNAIAASITPPIATALGIMSWLVVAGVKFGKVDVNTTFEDDAMITGNVVSLLVPMFLVPALTWWFKPQNFDWDILSKIRRVDEEEELIEAEAVGIDELMDLELAEKTEKPPLTGGEKDASLAKITSQTSRAAYDIAQVDEEAYTAELEQLGRNFNYVLIFCIAVTLCFLILWPMPMYGTGYQFSKKFFTGWIVVGFIWIWVTTIVVVVGPVWESREGIFYAFRGMYWDLTGRGYKVKEWQLAHQEKLHLVQSQVVAILSNKSHGGN